MLPVPGTECSFDYLFHFHIFLKAFTLQGPLLDRSSLIHNLEFPLSKPKSWEHLTVIKCILLQCAAMWLTCRSSRRKWLVFAKFWASMDYNIIENLRLFVSTLS